jgi:hypothetical protein
MYMFSRSLAGQWYGYMAQALLRLEVFIPKARPLMSVDQRPFTSPGLNRSMIGERFIDFLSRGADSFV